LCAVSRESRLLSDRLKTEVPQIPKESQLMISRQQDVQQSVAIVVANRAPGPIGVLLFQSAGGGHILELSAPCIAEQERVRVVDEQDILPAVVVGVEGRAAFSKRF